MEGLVLAVKLSVGRAVELMEEVELPVGTVGLVENVVLA